MNLFLRAFPKASNNRQASNFARILSGNPFLEKNAEAQLKILTK